MAALPQAPTLLFAPAAGEAIGGGHVMRSLALATALAERGARCVFALPAAGRSILGRFAREPFEVLPIERSGDPAALARLRASLDPDALVLDDYALGAAEENAVVADGARLVVIDDLSNRLHLCDLLIDPGFGRTTSHYVRIVPPGCDLLLGPQYALLRPEIAARAREVPPPHRVSVERVFVSFGLSDVGGIAARALDRLRPLATEARFDVALASDAASAPALIDMAGRVPGVRVHLDAPDVAGLIAEADLAVGAGGSATWERACLGCPSLAVIVADNQRAMIEGLAADGALLAVDMAAPDFEEALAGAFPRLLGDADLRADLATRARALCDGQGAHRAAEAILARLRS